MLKVGVPGFTQVPQLLVYNHFYALHQKSSRAHSAAPPLQIEPSPLGFDLVPCQSTKGGLISFAYSPRDSKGAGVNEVPGARQSRDLARPQARSPVRVTTSEQSPLLLASSWFVTFFYTAAHSVGLAVYFLCSAPPLRIEPAYGLALIQFLFL